MLWCGKDVFFDCCKMGKRIVKVVENGSDFLLKFSLIEG